jgi:hypothetical protein
VPTQFITWHILTLSRRGLLFLFSTISSWKWIHKLNKPIKFDSWVVLRLSPAYQPRVIDEYAAIGELRTGRGNPSARRKPASITRCPLRILHDPTWYRARVVAVRNRWLAVWATARHCLLKIKYLLRRIREFSAFFFGHDPEHLPHVPYTHNPSALDTWFGIADGHFPCFPTIMPSEILVSRSELCAPQILTFLISLLQ